jgi:DNA-binding MarR family transcriptional regulator
VGGGVDERHEEAMRLYARAMSVVDPVRIRAWAEAELTTGQLRVLFLLRGEPAASLGDVAAHLDVSAPTASGFVDRLVRQGLLRREVDERDRRVVRHRLTPRGVRVTAELEREGRALLEGILSRLDERELEALLAGLAAFVRAAAAEPEPAPAGAGQ